MNVFVELDKVMSEGRLAGRNYFLTCVGSMSKTGIIIINPARSIYEFFNDQTLTNDNHPIAVFSFPLHVRTFIIMKVKDERNLWQQTLQIDLENWDFSIQPHHQEEAAMPLAISRQLMSAFGIKKGRRIISFATLAKVNKKGVP